MRNRLLAFSLALVLMASVQAFAAPGELDWISHLPGVTLASHNASDSSIQNTYTIAGNVPSSFKAIVQHLRDSGWTVENGSRVSAGATQIMNLIAHRGSINMNLSLNGSNSMSTLMMVVQAPPGTFPTSHLAPAPGTANLSGPQITMNNNHQKITLNGSSSQAAINGNDNTLTFHGTWRSVTINGNDNVMSFDSTIDEVVLNGSSNQVTWSTSKNPKAPRIVDHGDINAVNEVP